MSQTYSIVVEKDENGMYVGEIPELPACYTQAKTFDELLGRITEVAEGSVKMVEDTYFII